jgi:uracil-DNA glycosylase
MTEAEALLRRYLRQRREIGEETIFLERLAAADLRAVLRGGGSSAVGPPALCPPAPDDSGGLPAGVPAPVPAAAPGTGVAALDLGAVPSLEVLRDLALPCTRCRLAASRTQVVFGEGDPAADLVVVGEAPGAEEDRTGRPFVGRAGKLLDLLLASIGFPREAVYICNVLKCRPPANRNPEPAEVQACSPYLLRQIELVRPRVILACGAFAAQTLLDTSVPIGRLRGGSHTYGGVPLVPTYHPAALLRNPGWIRPVWEDLQRLRTVLDAA